MTTLNSGMENAILAYILQSDFSMPEVLHNICNMRSGDLPDMSTLALGHCTPLCSCVHIRQITPAHVTYITCTIQTVHVLTLMICFYKDIDNTVVQDGKVSWISWVNWQTRNFYSKTFSLSFKNGGSRSRVFFKEFL